MLSAFIWNTSRYEMCSRTEHKCWDILHLHTKQCTFTPAFHKIQFLYYVICPNRSEFTAQIYSALCLPWVTWCIWMTDLEQICCAQGIWIDASRMLAVALRCTFLFRSDEQVAHKHKRSHDTHQLPGQYCRQVFDFFPSWNVSTWKVNGFPAQHHVC